MTSKDNSGELFGKKWSALADDFRTFLLLPAGAYAEFAAV
jgi:hypothetical protein